MARPSVAVQGHAATESAAMRRELPDGSAEFPAPAIQRGSGASDVESVGVNKVLAFFRELVDQAAQFGEASVGGALMGGILAARIAARLAANTASTGAHPRAVPSAMSHTSALSSVSGNLVAEVDRCLPKASSNGCSWSCIAELENQEIGMADSLDRWCQIRPWRGRRAPSGSPRRARGDPPLSRTAAPLERIAVTRRSAARLRSCPDPLCVVQDGFQRRALISASRCRAPCHIDRQGRRFVAREVVHLRMSIGSIVVASLAGVRRFTRGEVAPLQCSGGRGYGRPNRRRYGGKRMRLRIANHDGRTGSGLWRACRAPWLADPPPLLDVTAMVGYRAGGEFEDVDPESTTNNTLDLDDGTSIGIRSRPLSRYGSFYEILYSRQGRASTARTRWSAASMSRPSTPQLRRHAASFRMNTGSCRGCRSRSAPRGSIPTAASTPKPISPPASAGGVRLPFNERIAANIGVRGYVTLVDSDTRDLLCRQRRS